MEGNGECTHMEGLAEGYPPATRKTVASFWRYMAMDTCYSIVQVIYIPAQTPTATDEYTA